MSNFKEMGDRELYDYCQKAGLNARKHTRMLVAAIPEVYKRGLHRKYGFGSIHEFGAKVGGLSHGTVNEAIRVSEKLKDKPKLVALMGEVGLSKLKVVANIATKETEKEWAKRTKQLTRAALETKVRDIRASLPGERRNTQLSLTEDQNDPSQPPTLDYMSSRDAFTVKLNPQIIQQLQILKANMQSGTTWNDVFKKLLNAKKINKQRARGLKAVTKPICEALGCEKPAVEIHHKNRWAITKKHDNLISLCRAHHELKHQTNHPVDIKFRSYLHVATQIS